ncbi:DHH family phosphoesterase [Tautonia sociabilis]|uniref:Bifunctional oligoribonuclease/PAP phosphatase NrnA n=1 Tax=Tautonia sociabilis TaxID=2080755 RepID=A0A432MPC3_9BACT|nr:bifunctional oligoribonuclease/PAP phosphatase NrnA [Tautonia sociabilis]RUL88945.1 bifunctional oligoribonuclease/PAP phosphatase NrnA [Tautonia sociabilis]
MDLDWSPLGELIGAHRRFLITTHVRPDGDALGSEVGLAGLLEQRGKDVRVVNVSPTPPRYDFLAPRPRFFERFADVRAENLTDREALIILDLSSWSQLGDMSGFVRDFVGPKLVIDHHVSQDDLGAVVLKDETAEATGTLILRAARALNAAITPVMAAGLMTAIAMDTGWFRHSNVRPGTLRDAAELAEAGAPVHGIYRMLFERNSPERMRLVGRALASLNLTLDGRVAYSAVTRDDLSKTGAIPSDTEDLIDQLAGISGVEVAMLLIEQPRGGVKVSLRSRGEIDVAQLASRFGGGGHRAAAGALMPDPLSDSRERVLRALRSMMGAEEPS